MALVFIHEGYSEYLEFTLRQAHAASPASEIVLLGNAENDRFPFVTHVDVSRGAYAAAATQLAEVYEHRSTNGETFERVCFERWYRLQEWMRQSGEERVLVLDSDVLLFAREDEIFSTYPGPLALSISGDQEKEMVWAASPHTSVWTPASLEAFCAFTLSQFRQPGRFDRKWEHHRVTGTPGGVCDMTALYLFSREHLATNTAEARGGVAVDHNLNVPHNAHPDEYAMDGAAKALDWRDGQPWGTNRQTGEAVRFLALHLQGQAKGQIPALYTGPAFENQKALGDGLRRYFAARALAGRVKATAWRAVSRLRGR